MNQETENIISSIAFENIEKHPNILIAARFWDDRRYQAAKVCYKFMRRIDDYIDDRKARDVEISCLEKEELSKQVNRRCICCYPALLVEWRGLCMLASLQMKFVCLASIWVERRPTFR